MVQNNILGNPYKPTVVSIFSGGGGMDLGFFNAGYNILYSTDNCEIACETLRTNGHSVEVECLDIEDVDFKRTFELFNIIELDCLIGGPPCPAFSKARFGWVGKKRALEDPNSFTLKEYFRAVGEMKPKVFLFENVDGFQYKPHRAALNYLISESEKLGYEINFKIMNAADYGVPQIRKRFICVGVKKGLDEFIFPKKTHNCDSWVTCSDALGSLSPPLLKDAEIRVNPKEKSLLKEIPPGENYLYFTEKRGHPSPQFEWRSRFWTFLLKLSPDKPSWTITAIYANNTGPFHWDNRHLYISELKRIQTFDDEYVIEGTYKQQKRQIGNALPPLLTCCLAESIKNQYFVLQPEYV